MNILETIIAQKRKEVDDKQRSMAIDSLMSSSTAFGTNCLSLKDALMSDRATGIIAEFKRRSPSKGWIHEGIGISEVVRSYESNGASGISVLTDREFFGGDIEELKLARAHVGIPLLRKDFMVDEYQLYEAKSYGADVILLIAACLSTDEVRKLARKARELKLETLLEVHHEEELDHITHEIDIIGVNNRNLGTFETDIKTSMRLIKYMPGDKPVISESGISDVATILKLRDAGFKGFLIGETFMKEKSPAIAFADFMKSLDKGSNLIQHSNE